MWGWALWRERGGEVGAHTSSLAFSSASTSSAASAFTSGRFAAAHSAWASAMSAGEGAWRGRWSHSHLAGTQVRLGCGAAASPPPHTPQRTSIMMHTTSTTSKLRQRARTSVPLLLRLDLGCKLLHRGCTSRNPSEQTRWPPPQSLARQRSRGSDQSSRKGCERHGEQWRWEAGVTKRHAVGWCLSGRRCS